MIRRKTMNDRLISVGEAERMARDIPSGDKDELFDLAYRVLNQDNIFGAENDYHNFSLNYSRLDAYELACDILEKGLAQYPKSVDLLADYLQVGISCKRLEECEKCYKTLMEIPQIRWTWRGFSFSIDYLMYLASFSNEEELFAMKEQLLSLSQRYLDTFPTEEDPYICKADIFDFYNDKQSTKATLVEAINTLIVCPKCSLRLADLLFDEGEYEKSLDILNKCLYQSIQTQDSVNHAYLFYLSGLCKTVLLLKKGDFQNTNEVTEIYHDFAIAQKTGLYHPSYVKVMRRQIDILEVHSGISYTD